MFANAIDLLITWGRAGLGWVFLGVGALGSLYFFWRKAEVEHYDLGAAFDALLVAALSGVAGARLGYILLHPLEFGASPLKLLNIISYPGLWPATGFLAAFYALYRFANQNKLDWWEVWDFFVIALTWYLGWHWLSRLAVGAAAGTSTGLPWGMMFPNRLEPAHPVQLYAAAAFLILFAYLNWAETRYRFFFWYRSKKRTAKPGFLVSGFLIGWGLLQFALSFVQPTFFLLPGGFELNQVLGFLIFLSGCALLYLRSGRSIFSR
jgi:phosphatidylglycerol:prolipoprotein diacylglycerol transferase